MPPKKQRKNQHPAQKCQPLPEAASGVKGKNKDVEINACKRSSIRMRKPSTSLNLGCTNRNRSLSKNGVGEANLKQRSASRAKTTPLAKPVKSEYKGDIFSLQSLADATLTATLQTSLKNAEKKNNLQIALKRQTATAKQVKSVPSQSWSVNVDSLSSLKRTSTTLISESLLKRGKLPSPQTYRGINLIETKQQNHTLPNKTKDRIEETDILVEKNYGPHEKNGLEKNIQQSVDHDLKHISELMKQSIKHSSGSANGESCMHNFPSDEITLRYKRNLKYEADDRWNPVDNDDTDLSMIPIKNSDSIECLTLASQYTTDKSLIDFPKKDCYTSRFDIMTQCRASDEQNNVLLCSQNTVSLPYCQRRFEYDPYLFKVNNEEYRPALRRRKDKYNAKMLSVPEVPPSKSQIYNATSDVDWSTFTPVCHIYDFSTHGKNSATNTVSRCEDESLEVINLKEHNFLNSAIAVMDANLKDTSTWMTAQQCECSQIPLLFSAHEKKQAKNNKNIRLNDSTEDSSCTTAGVASLEMSLRKAARRDKRTDKELSPIEDECNMPREIVNVDSKAKVESKASNKKEIPKKIALSKVEINQTTETIVDKQCWHSEHTRHSKPNFPNEPELNVISVESTHAVPIKRTCLQRRKPNDKHLGAEKQNPKSLKKSQMTKNDQTTSSKRVSQRRELEEVSYNFIPYLSPQIKTKKCTETLHRANYRNKDDAVRCSQFSPRKTPNDTATKVRRCISSAKSCEEGQNSKKATSYPVASKEESKQLSNDKDLLKRSVPTKNCKSVDVFKHLSTNAFTNTTKSLVDLTPENISPIPNKRKLKIRVFAKPSKLKTRKILLRETHVILPGPGKENTKEVQTDHQQVIEEVNLTKGIAEVEKEPRAIQSRDSQFQSMQEYHPCKKEAAHQSSAAEVKQPEKLHSKTDLEPAKYTPQNPKTDNVIIGTELPDNTAVSKPSCSSSTTSWEDVICSSVHERKIISGRRANRRSARYPSSQVRRPEAQPVKAVWDQFRLGIESLLRLSIMILLVFCFLYFILMMVHNLHNVHLHHS